VALHLWLVWGGRFPGDSWALEQGGRTHSHAVNAYANLFQDLGTHALATLIVAAALIVLLRQRLFTETAGLIVACLAVPLNAVLKLVLGPSPIWVAADRAGHNFPSGHVTFVTAVIGYIGLLAWRHGKWWLTVVAIVLIIGAGPARVVTGIHLVSDCVAGYLVGAAMLLLAGQFATQRSRRQSRWNIASSDSPV
jgi:membrane-associated phospholipid phosphatase